MFPRILTYLFVLHYLILLLIPKCFQAFHHRLSKRDLRQIFDVEHHSDVPEYSFIDKRREELKNGNLILEFLAWNESFSLELWPNRRLLSPHLTSAIYESYTLREHKGLPSTFDYNCHYHGLVKSHGNVSAAISNCRSLMGIFVMDDHFLVLQTIPPRLKNNQSKSHIIYKRSASLLSSLEQSLETQLKKLNQEEAGVEFCDVSESIDAFQNKLKSSEEGPTFNYSLPSQAKLDSLFIFPQMDPITLEVGLFLDAQLYEHFKRQYSRDVEQHLLDYSLALINNVHVLYQQSSMSPSLDIVIVRYELWKVQPPGLEARSHRNGQAQIFLNNWCRHQANMNPGTDLTDTGHWDHGILLTGFDIYHTTPSVAGVAPVARMCDPIYACSLVEGLHLGRSFVLAHEMGHNMGMVHDGVQNQCSRSCCLMSQVNGAGKTTWSACSVREFNAFLLQLDESGRGNCLRDAAESIATHDHLRDGRLPGQRFTPDQQCSYFWGKDFHVEIPQGRNMDDICRILWCGNSGAKISTAHPALEGSWCGNNKFCLEGQCTKWRVGPPPPKIDGGWSEWTGGERQCPIMQCQVTGSIRIKGQMRMCTNPAPNNGGKRCTGSQIRGILCDGIKSSCKGLSRQEFGTRLCTAIKNDPEKPDLQLSGPAFQHGTQPCKIWCHLIGSELIRHKGQYPDGSPCGMGRYCVGGQCLKLACNNEAVVSNEADCPALDSSFSEWSSWNSWSEWSSCSVSCGFFGIQKRKRTCKLGPEENCVGIKEDLRSCQPSPPLCETYSKWSEWSSCSATCGNGFQKRKRSCLGDLPCLDKLTEEKECIVGECPNWLTWESWSKCSATCGGGQKRRIRKCPVIGNCVGESTEVTPCGTEKCDEVTWGDWLPCSASCGSGFQIRERLCNGVICPERERQARTCNVEACSAKEKQLKDKILWDTWSDWLPCSETCGEGVQMRIRKCITSNCPKSDAITQQRRCVLRPCPQWSNWSEWSECPSCSSDEKRTRKRICKAGLVRINETEKDCPGSSEEVESCENSCKTVVRGVKTQSAENLSSRDLEKWNQKIPDSGKVFWNEWEPWQSCSATCGTGVRFRLRTCIDGYNCAGRGNFIEAGVCNEHPCDKVVWLPWSEWSACSVTCGKGRKTRHRTCKAAFVFLCDGSPYEDAPCSREPCSSNALLLIEKEQYQSDLPQWSEWSSWSQCSCFTMNQFRRRYCEIRDPSVQGFCTGTIIEQKPCIPTSCVSQNGEWSKWGTWSHCSRKCGKAGHQIRNRMCSDPVPSNRGSYCAGYSFDQRSCISNSPCSGPAVDGSWSGWTEWSTCSDNCINGHKSRTRYCVNPRPENGGAPCIGKDFEMQPCSNPELCSKSTNGEWSEWTEWSECSAKCGFAFQTRHRFCNNPKPSGGGAPCIGLATMSLLCSMKPCRAAIDGQWSSWNEWSACSVDCGIGTKMRTRTCTVPPSAEGGYPCSGANSEESRCSNDGNYLDADVVCSSAIRDGNVVENNEFRLLPVS